MKNKLLVIALILSMVFTLSACGGNSGNGSSEKGISWELKEDGYESDYDFGAETADGGVLTGTLEKLDYSDLSALQEKLQSAAEEGIASAGLGSFEFITDFEPMEESLEEAQAEGYEVGDLVYCSGMEDDDMDQAAFESGCYNNPMDGKYYQYSIFSTKSYYGSDKMDLDEVINTVKTTYGITLDKAKLQKAVEAIEAKSKEPIPEDASQDEEGEDIEEGDIEDDEEGDEESEEFDSEDMVFVDEDGNEIDLSELELEEEEGDLEDGEEFEVEAEDEEEADAEDGEDADEEDEDLGELSEEEMDDLIFAEEDGFEGGYPCLISQKIENAGEGYNDKITVSLIAQQVSEEDSILYVSVEVDRCYDEQ